MRIRCLQLRLLCSSGSRTRNNSLKKIADNWITKLAQCGIDEPELSVKYIVEKALAKVG